jgi:hypothetical protein
MKATKLIALVSFAMLGLGTQAVMAQTTDETEQTAPPATDESATQSTEAPETDPYNETVTIDDGSETGTTNTDYVPDAAPAEKKERLRVYSGKHDGNNVIVDPR